MSKLSPQRRNHLRKLNYEKAKNNIKYGEAEITKSQKRQSQVGKGDFPRSVNKQKYDSNFELINWNSKRSK